MKAKYEENFSALLTLGAQIMSTHYEGLSKTKILLLDYMVMCDMVKSLSMLGIHEIISH